jgi:hypothetical protein
LKRLRFLTRDYHQDVRCADLIDVGNILATMFLTSRARSGIISGVANFGMQPSQPPPQINSRRGRRRPQFEQTSFLRSVWVRIFGGNCVEIERRGRAVQAGIVAADQRHPPHARIGKLGQRRRVIVDPAAPLQMIDKLLLALDARIARIAADGGGPP